MLRRDFRLFVRCAAASLILLLAALAVSVGAVRLLVGEGSLFTPVKIAVVDGEDSIISRILVKTVRNLDAFSSILDAEVMDGEEADACFASGECAAVVTLPGGFVSSITGGEKAGGTIRLSKALASNGELVEKVAAFGETMLAAGQYGVFAGEELLSDAHAPWSVTEDYLNRVNASLTEEALNATGAYFSVEVAAADGLDLRGHYILCWMALTLFLTTLSFVPLFRVDARGAIVRRMTAQGAGCCVFLRWKLMITAAWRFLLLLAAFAALNGFGVLPLSLHVVLGCLLASVWMAVIGACLSLCFGSGAAAVCLTAGGGMIVSGGVIPKPLLPNWMLTVGELLPFGALRGLLTPRCSAVSLAVAAVYLVLACVLLRRHWKKLARGEEEART